MAILQAIISLLARSASTVLNAIFGWAVIALFGRTSPKQQTLLSALVGLAAAWPVLLLGIVVPKIATFAISFVPLSQNIPSAPVRIVWLLLALAVPIVVGLVVASKAPPGTLRESFLRRALRGFPITLGIACAFVLMLVTVPVLRLVSIVRGRTDEHVPCITDGTGYDQIALDIERILRRHALDASRAEPSWWLSGPAKVLQKLGGKALRGFMPAKLAYWKGEKLEVAFYPSDVLIRGEKARAAWVHGVLAEQLAHGPGLQTFDAQTQELERELRQVWSVYDENPRAHTHSKALLARLADVTRRLGKVTGGYDDWQVVYRQALQLGRALDGEEQLLEQHREHPEESMENETGRSSLARPLSGAPTQELVGDLLSQSAELVKKEVALARTELRAQLKQEIKMASGLGVAGVCALCTLNLLLVAVVLAIAENLPGWASALIVAAAVLVIGTVAGLIGWSMRVKQPLEKTRKTLEEDVRWAKERVA